MVMLETSASCISVHTFLLGFRHPHDMWAGYEVRQGFLRGDETTVFGVSCTRLDPTKAKEGASEPSIMMSRNSLALAWSVVMNK